MNDIEKEIRIFLETGTKELNIKYGTLKTRIKRGWSIERALNQEIG